MPHTLIRWVAMGYFAAAIALSIPPVLAEGGLVPFAQQRLAAEVVTQILATPDAVRPILMASGNDPRYRNVLSEAELIRLLADSDDEDAVADAAKGLLEEAPTKLVSVHHEVVGEVRDEQLAALEALIREWVLDQRIRVQGETVAYQPPPLWPKLLVGGAVAAGVAAAAGGGGGGGAPVVPWTPPSFAVTSDYAIDYRHQLVGTEQAHSRGYDGSSVIVGVIDTGFLATHEELNGQFVDLYNVYTGVSGASASGDPDGHGTHVAGILVARRDGDGITGVAPGAKLVGIRIGNDTDGSLTATDTQLAEGVDYARLAGSAFVNNSWGFQEPTDQFSAASLTASHPQLLAAYSAAASADVVMVFATGNEREAHPQQPLVLAGLPALFPSLKEHWVAVGAVGADGILASYSQPCGVAADWCLVAPGGDDDEFIYSSWNDGGVRGAQGTSMATPMVTGALAVLKQRFPTLSNQAVVDRLFLTANKSGIYAERSLYGQGLLDLNKATEPVGSLALVNPTQSTLQGDAALPLDDARVALSASYGNALLTAMADVRVAVADSQGAGFFVDFEALVQHRYRFDLAQALARFREPERIDRLSLGGGMLLELGFDGHHEETDLRRMLIRERQGALQVGVGLTAAPMALVAPTLPRTLAVSHAASRFALPYLDPQLAYWSAGMNWSQGAWRLALLGAAPERRDDKLEAMASRLGLIRVGWQPDERLHLALLAGQGREQAALLGARFEGALGLASDTPFSFVGLESAWQLASATRLSAVAHLARARPAVRAGSLIRAISPQLASSFALGLEQRLDRQRQLGITLTQPLRVERGALQLTLSTGYDGNHFNRTDYSADTAASARQLDYELFYRVQGPNHLEFKTSLIYQQHPGHREVSGNAVGLLSLTRRF